ncbi:MAG: DapH/DapD/GlmU-related protein [Candidatus Omnitrophota bacterium]
MRNKLTDCVSLGKGCKIDEFAFIGQRPFRRIPRLKMIIGGKAVCLRGAVVYLGSRIGKNLFLGHNSIIREENIIGDNFKLWSNSIVDYGCKIGDNVKIHSNCYVAQFTHIEDDCFLAPGVVIANDPHPGCRFSKSCLKGPTIKKGAQIGCNATILPNITIGKNVIVGAGSVVTRDVLDRQVVCGNPARVIKSIDKIECALYPGQKYQRMK